MGGKLWRGVVCIWLARGYCGAKAAFFRGSLAHTDVASLAPLVLAPLDNG